jgi:hypothetical protein
LRQDCDPGKQKLKGAVRTETYRRHYCQHLECLVCDRAVHRGLAEHGEGRSEYSLQDDCNNLGARESRRTQGRAGGWTSSVREGGGARSGTREEGPEIGSPGKGRDLRRRESVPGLGPAD